MKNLTIVSIAAFATCLCSIAGAETASAPRTETVRFADLDLNRPPGAEALYQRLENAAKRVCRDLEPGRRLAMKSTYDNCRNVALRTAVVDLDRPAVTAYAEGRGVLPAGAGMKIARHN